MSANISEFFLGGVAAMGACLFSNPLEVVNTRMQLQGELKARGSYQRHYRNVFHAFYAIGRYDGLTALQKGLAPALWYQLFMNGVRLGTYQCFINIGFTKKSNGDVSIPKSIVAGAIAGCAGAFVGSPFYLVSILVFIWKPMIVAYMYMKKARSIQFWWYINTPINCITHHDLWERCVMGASFTKVILTEGTVMGSQMSISVDPLRCIIHVIVSHQDSLGESKSKFCVSQFCSQVASLYVNMRMSLTGGDTGVCHSM